MNLTIFEMSQLADLHYEQYDSMLSLRLHREGTCKMTRDMYEKECARYSAASEKIEQIINRQRETLNCVQLAEKVLAA